MPGGDGIRSPTLSNARPETVTPVDAKGPMVSGYGTPVSELIMVHIDPVVASGMPPAVISGGKIVIIVPESGAPAAPGVTITAAPRDTGGPGMSFPQGENDVTP